MPITDDYFNDFNKLVKLCEENPKKAGLLRKQLFDRLTNDVSKQVLLQHQYELEHRLSTITCPDKKLLEIQQQLLQNAEQLSQCVSKLKQSCITIERLIK